MPQSTVYPVVDFLSAKMNTNFANGDLHIGNPTAQAMENVGREIIITTKEG
jgi:hypothetical protein